jgi:hypothetical protein
MVIVIVQVNIKTMAGKKHYVYQKDFIEWVLSGPDDIKAIGQRIYEALLTEKYGKITVRELFDECGYLPSHIVHTYDTNYDMEDIEEIDPSDCKLIYN